MVNERVVYNIRIKPSQGLEGLSQDDGYVRRSQEELERLHRAKQRVMAPVDRYFRNELKLDERDYQLQVETLMVIACLSEEQKKSLMEQPFFEGLGEDESIVKAKK